MAETYNAGVVTAYGAAVRGGYTGTYEQWCADMAQLGDNVAEVREKAEQVDQTAQTFTEQTVPNAIKDVEDKGTEQTAAVEEAGTAQIQQVNEAGTQKVSDVTTAGANALSDINTAKASAIAAVQTESTTQQSAIQQKGAETLASIPDDYTELSEDVDDLKSQIDNVASMERPSIDFNWEHGGIDNATGATNNDGSTTRSRDVTYYKIPDLYSVTNGSSVVLWCIIYKYENEAFSFSGKTSVSPGNTHKFSSSDNYVRFDLRGSLTEASKVSGSKRFVPLVTDVKELDNSDIKNNNGWLNTVNDPYKVLYSNFLAPRMHNGTINYTSGVIAVDEDSNNIFSDLFTLESDAQLILKSSGFRRRVVQYNASTGDVISSGNWSSEDQDRLTIIPASDNVAFRVSFYGSSMSDPVDSLKFIYENVRIYTGSDDGIANYLRSEYDNTIQSVQGLANPDTVSFAFMTDLHFSNKNSGYYEQTLRTGIVNTKNVLKRFAEEFPLATAVFGGDYMQMPTIANGMTVQSGIDNLSEVNRWLSELECPHIALSGNHEVGYRTGTTTGVDAGTDYGLTNDQIYTLLSKRYLDANVKEASRNVFYFIDDTSKIIWVFVSHPTTAFNSVIQSGFDVVAALNANRYPLVCFSHYGLNNSGEVVFNADSAIDYLQTQKGQTIIAWISGHIHADWSAVYNGVLIVACLQSGSTNSSAASQDGVVYAHTDYSDTESALSIFTIDKAVGKLYCTRFGLGVDREFNYNPTSGPVGLVTT